MGWDGGPPVRFVAGYSDICFSENTRLRFTFFIALRYLFSKKSRNVINVITAISMITVGIITASLVILLSAFNGLESKIEELFNAFDPDLKVQPLTGKTMAVSDDNLETIRSLPGILRVTRVIEESALFVYDKSQYIGKLKGVDDAFLEMVKMDTLVRHGRPLLHSGRSAFALLGDEASNTLRVNYNSSEFLLQVFYPKRGKIDMLQPFRELAIMPGGEFDLQQQDFNRYVLVPLDFAREIMGYETEVSALEIQLKPGADESAVRRGIRGSLGAGVAIKNRYEQQELMYKVLRSEKLAMFLIVTLILVIASFNLISALTMLVVEKKKDIMVLWSLGTTFRRIKIIYVTEGTLVAVIGALGGLLLGGLVAFLQQQTGLIKLGNGPDAPDYPVVFHLMDFVIIFLTVSCIGFVASWLRMKGIRLSRPDNYTLLK